MTASLTIKNSNDHNGNNSNHNNSKSHSNGRKEQNNNSQRMNATTAVTIATLAACRHNNGCHNDRANYNGCNTTTNNNSNNNYNIDSICGNKELEMFVAKAQNVSHCFDNKRTEKAAKGRNVPREVNQVSPDNNFLAVAAAWI